MTDNLSMFDIDPRKEKRYVRKMWGRDQVVYEAYTLGEYHADAGKPKRNPYPPGRRHDEYERGYNLSDPMGDHHRRNA